MTIMVRVAADFALAAVRLRLDAPFTVWLAARALDPEGAGRASISELRALFARARLARAFATPLFRGWKGDFAFYASAPKAMGILGLTRVRTAGFVAPLEALRAGAALRRAGLTFGAFSALRAGKPISITAIAGAVGVERTTISRWLKRSRWPRRRRFMLHNSPVTPGALRWLRAAQPGPWLIVRRRGRLRLARRLPNALYQRWASESRTWMARRVNAARPVSHLHTQALHGQRAAPAGHPANLKHSPGERALPLCPLLPAASLSAEKRSAFLSRGLALSVGAAEARRA